MCVFAMSCVVPSVRLPRVCGHNLVPPRPVTAAVGKRVRGARREHEPRATSRVNLRSH